MNRRIDIWPVLAMLTLLTAPAFGGIRTVQLRSTARVDPGAPIRVADVARVSGDEAGSVGAIVVEASPDWATGAWLEIDAAAVRGAIEASGLAKTCHVAVSGRACSVGRRPQRPPAAPEQAGGPQPVAEPEETGPTVRDAIATRLAMLLGVPGADLRLTFEARDGGVLGTGVEGRAVDVQPTGSADRMPLAITVLEGERIVISETISVGVLVRRPVVVAQGVMGRRERVDPARVTSETRWIGPTADPATMADLAGAVTRVRLEPGEIVLRGHVEQPFVVRRGDLVTAYTSAGTIMVRTRARALDKARVGEVVELESEQGGSRFRARMSGPGRAVVVQDEAPKPQASQLGGGP